MVQMALVTGRRPNSIRAREQFLAAVAKAGLAVETHEHQLKGPNGETLATDVGWFGSASADRILITISGTHGVEGFCGSGVQVGTLRSKFINELPSGMAILMIHALNPYGFAWLRRVTENNVDLNRNFVNFSEPLPNNPGYEEIADIVAPTEWTEATPGRLLRELAAYAAEHGSEGLTQAVSTGQYSHPNGVFFGGHEPS